MVSGIAQTASNDEANTSVCVYNRRNGDMRGGRSLQEPTDERHEALPFFEKWCMARILEFMVRNMGQLLGPQLNDKVLDEILRAVNY